MNLDQIVNPSRRGFLKGISAFTAAALVPNLALAQETKSTLKLQEYSSLSEAVSKFDELSQAVIAADGNLVALAPNVKFNPLVAKLQEEGKNYVISVDVEKSLQDAVVNLLRANDITNIQQISKPKGQVIQANAGEGVYIQVSARQSDEVTRDNYSYLEKAGLNPVLFRDTGVKRTKVLLGPYQTAEIASQEAERLIHTDDFSNELDTNELGVIQISSRNGTKLVTWKDVVRYISPADINSQKTQDALKKRMTKRAKEEMATGHHGYSVQEVEKIIKDAVDKRAREGYSINLNLARAIAYCESTYNPNEIASIKRVRKDKNGKVIKNKDGSDSVYFVKGGRGLFQLMPETAKITAGRPISEKELLDPVINAYIGVKLVHDLHNLAIVKNAPKEKQLDLVLAAYNGGPGCLKQDKRNTALRVYENTAYKGYAQTRHYVVKVKRALNSFNSE